MASLNLYEIHRTAILHGAEVRKSLMPNLADFDAVLERYATSDGVDLQNVLVTGGASYIGSHACKALARVYADQGAVASGIKFQPPVAITKGPVS